VYIYIHICIYIYIYIYVYTCICSRISEHEVFQMISFQVIICIYSRICLEEGSLDDNDIQGKKELFPFCLFCVLFHIHEIFQMISFQVIVPECQFMNVCIYIYTYMYIQSHLSGGGLAR